jgi:prepilin-type N-terminal cleavage/methylation domain-containing protein
MNKQTGFTLVEIAIVMVIIGLLLGGVLKGQQIILDAKLKNLENQFNGTTAAYYTYLDRYRALAGDHKNADTYFSGVATSSANGGNGKIEGNFDSTTEGEESRLFWLHLRNAGLVAGGTDDQNQPSNPFGGVIGVSTGNVAEIYGLFVGFSNIPKTTAIMIDLRRDDGGAQSGSIQGNGNDDYGDDKLYDLYFTL